MATSGDIESNDQYVSIDLGETFAVDKVIAYWRALAYSKDYNVEGSLDGKTWFIIEKNVNPDVKFKEGLARPEKSDRGDPMAVVETLAGGEKMRYVRLYAVKGSDFFVTYDWNYLQLMEVKVYPVIE